MGKRFKVVCTNNIPWIKALTVGEEYLVEMAKKSEDDEEYVQLVGEDGKLDPTLYYKSRFKFCSQEPEPEKVTAVCIDNSEWEDCLDLGKEYVIESYSDDQEFVRVTGKDGKSQLYFKKRFRFNGPQETNKEKFITKMMIVCLNNLGLEDRFEIGKEYMVVGTSTAGELVEVIDNDGKPIEVFAARFKFTKFVSPKHDGLQMAEDLRKIEETMAKQLLIPNGFRQRNSLARKGRRCNKG